MDRRSFICGSAASLLAGQSAEAFFKKGWQSVSQLQAVALTRKFGIFITYSMATFLDNDSPPAGEPLSTYATGPNWPQVCFNIRNAKKSTDPYIYAVFVAKHEDGFCQWPTATTTYNVTQTPWYAANGNPDVTGLFVSTCRNNGIIPYIYLCARDLTLDATSPSQATYKAYLQSQLLELLNNYPGLGGIWLDADNTAFFPSQGYPWASCGEATGFITGAKQNIITTNNCQGSFTLADSNLVEYEGGTYPGQFVPPGNIVPSESCETIYIGSVGPWFWKSTSPSLRLASDMITNINLANSRACNYLLNFPPDNTGNIESRMQTVMATIGARS